MASLSHALALADAVRQQLHCAPDSPQHRATTDTEIAAGLAQKEKAKSALKSSIAVVNETLAALRKAAPTDQQVAVATEEPVFNSPMRLKHDTHASLGARINTLASTVAAGTPVENVKDAMSANGLKPTTQSLEQMANAVGPIIDKFDSILVKPYLNNYNATLNTVPVVALKNNQILYIETTQSTIVGGGGLQDIWSPFSDLPAGVVVRPTDKVFMFPYKGDFYLSVGRAVWKKAHISDSDPARASATDHWPNLYVKEWEKIGDTVLPAADLNGVVPFAVLSADAETIAFQLVCLLANGSLSYLTSGSLGAGATFETLKYVASSDTPTAPVFSKVAYWNNKIVGIDGSSRTWNVTPTWTAGTWTAADPVAIEAVTEYTATDVGLIGLRADGYLYKRVVDAPPADSSADATLKWTRWIKADGATNIGVASPGVILDLKTLTRSLRSRYIEVQTSVYPVVDKIRAFGITHVFYLNQVMKDAQAWQEADTDEQRRLAIKNAKSFVSHAKQWSTIVSRSVGGAKESVNIMTKQLHDVRMQLETQLTLLRDKLTALQATLDTQNEALSKLKAAFWGSIAALFLGLVLAVVGVATGQAWLVVGAGVLFVAGIVAAAVLGSKVSELAGDIADTESQIRDVNTAIAEMSVIVASFQELDSLYGILNTFWGRMMNDASAIKTMDDATAFAVGEEILYDLSSIEAATDMTQRMADACQVYLDVLNKQGIRIPTKVRVSGLRAHGGASDALVRRSSPKVADNCGSDEDLVDCGFDEDQLERVIGLARAALQSGDLDAYASLMRRATLLYMMDLSIEAATIAATGVWYDVPSLQSAGMLWTPGGGSFSNSLFSVCEQRSVVLASTGVHSLGGVVDAVASLSSVTIAEAGWGFAAQTSALDVALKEARPYVRHMLGNVNGLGETIIGWLDRFPELPNDGGQMIEVGLLQERAVYDCELAQRYAALANNKFAEFNNMARQYQQDLQTSINATNDQITRRNAQGSAAIDNVSPPWYVYLGGAIALVAWTESEKSKIYSDWTRDLNNLKATVAGLQTLQQSGSTYSGMALNWLQMAQTVSQNLGSVYNILSGVWGQLLEDPYLYQELLRMEWGQVISSTDIVLAILNRGDPSFAAKRITGFKRALSFFRSPSMQLEDAAYSKDLVLKAVKPTSTLGPRVRGQASAAQSVFSNLDLLLQMPYARDIIGYWEASQTERKTLFDVTVSLRTEYVRMVATQYDSIQALYSLSILQEYRAKNVVDGKLPLPLFIQGTLQSVRAALNAASRTSTQFGNSAKSFEFVLGVIESNINAMEAKISELNGSIEDAEEQLRDKIIWIVADVIAIAFAAGVMLATFGVLGPVVGAVSLAVQLGATAAATAAGIKLVLDSMSLSDIAKTIASLKNLRESLVTSLGQLKAVQPLFKDVVAGVVELTSTITEMKDQLENVQGKLELFGPVSLTSADARAIKDSWVAVRDDTQAWMDVINAQGISPLSL